MAYWSREPKDPAKPLRRWTIRFQYDGGEIAVILPKGVYPDKPETERKIVELQVLANDLEDYFQQYGTDAERLPKRLEDRLNRSPDFRDRLAKKGLFKIPERSTLQELSQRYRNARFNDCKPNTQFNKAQTMRKLTDYFGPERVADSITERDARAFVDSLKERYAEATWTGDLKKIKGFWLWWKKEELVESDPFRDIPGGSFENKEREIYIPMKDFDKLLAVCPSREWRVLLTLCRVAGLRNPSETRLVRWDKIDFTPGSGSMTINAPKTERYKNKGERRFPLLPLLRRELEALKAEREATGEPFGPYVLETINLKADSNLRTTCQKMIVDARLEQWPRLFNNLRSSANIDLANEFPEHVCAEWVGHSVEIQRRHYLHATDEHIAKANALKSPNALDDANDGANDEEV